MRASVIFFSRFGNTQMVAEAIADGLAGDGTVRAVRIDQIDAAALAGKELVVAGSPTHKMKLPAEVKTALDALPKGTFRGAQVAAFDTSYQMSNFMARFTAAKKLDGKLRKLGGKRIAAPETFIVTGREGPLEEGELERAKAWATGIRTALVEGRI